MIRHALSTRLWHWINAAAIIVLFMTGLNISNAHRYLYWGDYGFDPKDAWLSVIKFPGWATIPQHYNLAVARDWHQHQAGRWEPDTAGRILASAKPMPCCSNLANRARAPEGQST